MRAIAAAAAGGASRLAARRRDRGTCRAAQPGAIYADGARGLALFEDRRPRHAGDILTVVITERSDASKQAGTSASRNGKLTADFGVTPKLLGGLLRGQDAALSADNGMTAKGGASATNSFDGVITVTVVEVRPMATSPSAARSRC